ncbi:MAG: mechanosensitive ion channel domain-containing protein [Spongiibacteraceae bacterium]
MPRICYSAIHYCIALSLYFCLLFITQQAYSQNFTETTTSLDQLRDKQNFLQLSTTVDAAVRTQALEQYRQAITKLETAQKDRKQAHQYAQALTTAPTELVNLQQKLAEPIEATTTASKGGLAKNNVSEIEQELLTKQSELLLMRDELADISTQIHTERELDLAAQLTQARQQAASSAEAATATGLEPVLAEAEAAVQSSTREAAEAHVEMLQQRILSRDLRLAKWDAQKALLTRKISIAEKGQSLLQTLLNERRQTVAGETVERVQLRVEELEDANDEVKRLANENAKLAQFISQINSENDTVSQEKQRIAAEQARIERYFNSITQQLAVDGAIRLPELGADLIEQKRALTKRRNNQAIIDRLDGDITRAQLSQLRLEDQLQDSAEATDGHDEALLNQVQAEHTRLLQDASVTHRRYIDTMITTRSNNRTLEAKINEYRNLLNSRLFWTPSTEPVSWHLWTGLPAEIKELLATSQQELITTTLRNTDIVSQLRTLAIILLALAIVLSRGSLVAILKRQAKYIGNVRRDKIHYTWSSFAISSVLTLPGPLVLMALSLLLNGADIFASQLALGLQNAAGLWLLLGLFRQICRDGGLGEKHFKWPENLRRAVKTNMHWFLIVLLPVVALSPILDGTAGGDVYHGLRRLTFAIASLALAYYVHRMFAAFLKPIETTKTVNTGWHHTTRYLFYPVAVIAPLFMLGLSWSGYHFTALEIEAKLFITACLIVSLVLLFYLIMRSISVSERRMALEQILAKRKNQQEKIDDRIAAEQAAEGIPDDLGFENYDLTRINTQTHAFLRMLTLLLGLLILWDLWSDILPALRLFDEWQLWHVMSDNPKVPDRWITFGDLLLAFSTVFLTYFGARNIPGSLELFVLRRAKLTAGSIYAITTILKYIIILAGFLVVVNLLGLQWSKLQWMVAAMGVGLGFGLQEIFANFVSGLLILFERPIRVGDTITVGSHTGTVSRIRIRATTLVDWDRKEQIIPNKTFISEQLTNWTLSDPITRLIVKVGVAYGSDIECVQKTLTQIIRNNSRVINDPPPAVFFVGFGDSSLNFEIRVFIKTLLDMMPLTHELHTTILLGLREQGIEIPFPQRDIWIRSADDDVDK